MTRKDVPGNAVASAEAVTREYVRFAEEVYRADKLIERLDEADVWVHDLRFKAPDSEHGEWFVIVRATVSQKRCVGFHAGVSFQEALRGTLARLQNGSMKWKDDQYA